MSTIIEQAKNTIEAARAAKEGIKANALRIYSELIARASSPDKGDADTLLKVTAQLDISLEEVEKDAAAAKDYRDAEQRRPSKADVDLAERDFADLNRRYLAAEKEHRQLNPHPATESDQLAMERARHAKELAYIKQAWSLRRLHTLQGIIREIDQQQRQLRKSHPRAFGEMLATAAPQSPALDIGPVGPQWSAPVPFIEPTEPEPLPIVAGAV